MNRRIINRVITGAFSVLFAVSQISFSAFAGELTAEELCEKYAFTYEIKYHDVYYIDTQESVSTYGMNFKSDASTVPMNDEQRADYLEKLKAADYDMDIIAAIANEYTEAYDGVIEGFKYKELENGTVKIVGMQYSYIEEHQPEELIIPEMINGKPVTVIGAKAFAHFGTGFTGWEETENFDVIKLKRIVIPDTVEIICDNAFDGCRIQSINLPTSIKYIGYRSFCCKGLRELARSTSGRDDLIILPDSIEFIAYDGLGELYSASMSEDGKTMIYNPTIQIPDSPVFIVSNNGYLSPSTYTDVYVDENGNSVNPYEQYSHSCFAGHTEQIVTGLDALRYYIDENAPECSYEDAENTVYVYMGDLNDTDALSTFLNQHGDNTKSMQRLQFRLYSELLPSISTELSADGDYDSYTLNQRLKETLIEMLGGDTAKAQKLYEYAAVPEFTKKQIVGDVNNDGKLTVADSVLLARLVAEDETASVSAQGLANADVNGDGEITSDDTTTLLKILSNN